MKNSLLKTTALGLLLSVTFSIETNLMASVSPTAFKGIQSELASRGEPALTPAEEGQLSALLAANSRSQSMVVTAIQRQRQAAAAAAAATAQAAREADLRAQRDAARGRIAEEQRAARARATAAAAGARGQAQREAARDQAARDAAANATQAQRDAEAARQRERLEAEIRNLQERLSRLNLRFFNKTGVERENAVLRTERERREGELQRARDGLARLADASMRDANESVRNLKKSKLQARWKEVISKVKDDNRAKRREEEARAQAARDAAANAAQVERLEARIRVLAGLLANSPSRDEHARLMEEQRRLREALRKARGDLQVLSASSRTKILGLEHSVVRGRWKGAINRVKDANRAKRKISGLQDVIKAQQDELRSKERDLASSKRQIEGTESLLKKSLRDVTELKAQRTTLQSTIEKKERELGTLREKIVRLVRKNSHQATRIQNLRSQLRYHIDKLKEGKPQSQEDRAAIADLTKQLEQAQILYRDASQQGVTLQTALVEIGEMLNVRNTSDPVQLARAIKDRIRELKETVGERHKLAAEAIKNYERLWRENREDVAALLSVQARCEELVRANNELTAELAAQEKRIAAERDDLEDARRQIDALNADNEKLLRIIVSIGDRLGITSDERLAIEQYSYKILSQIDEVLARNSAYAETIQAQNRNIANLTGLMSGLEQEITELQAGKLDSTQALGRQKTTIEDLKRQMRRIRDDYEVSFNGMREASEALEQEAKLQRTKLEKELTRLQQNLSQAQQETLEVQAEGEEVIEENQRLIKQLRSTIADLESRIDEATTSVQVTDLATASRERLDSMRVKLGNYKALMRLFIRQKGNPEAKDILAKFEELEGVVIQAIEQVRKVLPRTPLGVPFSSATEPAKGLYAVPGRSLLDSQDAAGQEFLE